MIAQGWRTCSGTLSKFISALSFLGLRCKMRVLKSVILKPFPRALVLSVVLMDAFKMVRQSREGCI